MHGEWQGADGTVIARVVLGCCPSEHSRSAVSGDRSGRQSVGQFVAQLGKQSGKQSGEQPGKQSSGQSNRGC